MKINDNVISIEDKQLSFPYPIKKKIELNDKIFLLINPVEEDIVCFRNVYCLDKNLNRLWKIKTFEGDDKSFVNLELVENKLIVLDINNEKFVINENDGSLSIFEEIEELNENKKLEEIEKKKPLEDNIVNRYINGDLKNSKKKDRKKGKVVTFEITELYIYKICTFIFGLIVIILLLTNTFYKMKINSLEKKLENSIEVSAELKSIIDNANKIIPDKETLKNVKDTAQVAVNVVKNTAKEKVNDLKEEETAKNTNENEEKYKGINEIIGIAEDAYKTIKNGDKKTIDDTNSSYITGSVVEVIDGAHVVLNIDGVEVTVKLISIDSNSSKNELEKALEGVSTVYIETDKKNYDGDNLCAYLWIKEPNSEELQNMVNYCLFKYGTAKFSLESPNVKYNTKFI